MSENEERLRDISYPLKSIAKALFITGNNILSEKLMEIQETISKAVTIDLNKNLEQAKQSTANVLSACLDSVFNGGGEELNVINSDGLRIKKLNNVKFVDRKEAAKIALNNSQCKKLITKGLLMSEDIW